MLALFILLSLIKVVNISYEYHEAKVVYEDMAKIFNEDNDIKILEFKENYEDIIAWISSKGTAIDYPIVKSNNNSDYLSKLPDGKSSASGSIFIDCRCEYPFKSFNTVVHGHHMKDGSMFCSLENYKDEEYYKRHKEMRISTTAREFQFQIVSSFITRTEDNVYKRNNFTTKEKKEFIEHINKCSDINTGVNVNEDDKLMTLSTCAYKFEGARRVVIGKLL